MEKSIYWTNKKNYTQQFYSWTIDQITVFFGNSKFNKHERDKKNNGSRMIRLFARYNIIKYNN